MNAFILLLVAVFVMFQILDAVTTSTALRQGGREANPFMSLVFKYIGVNLGLLIIKGAVSALVISVAVMGEFNSPTGMIILAAMDIFYAAIVVHNITVLER